MVVVVVQVVLLMAMVEAHMELVEQVGAVEIHMHMVVLGLFQTQVVLQHMEAEGR